MTASLSDSFLLAARTMSQSGSPNIMAPRVVAACYYATFHAFCESGGSLLVAHAWSRPRVVRMFGHEVLVRKARAMADAPTKQGAAGMKKWLASQAPPGVTSPPGNQLRAACTDLVRGYANRIEADYSGQRKMGQGDAIGALTRADVAVTAIRQLTKEQDHHLSCLLASVLWPKSPYDQSQD